MLNLFQLTILAGIAVPVLAAAQTFTTLYTFPTSGQAGQYPVGNLVVKGHDLYGTTEDGGAIGAGTVFEVNTVTGAEKVLHSFARGADGANPTLV